MIDIVPSMGTDRPRAVTNSGTVRADVVIRATEGYTCGLPGEKRTLVPLYSLMVATEPLSSDRWDEIGLREMETFADDRRMVIYGQRTSDDRIAFGGRGAPYRFGSGIDAATEARSDVHDAIAETLFELIPQLDGAAITLRWGGVLGVPRDWRPSVGLDRTTGLGWAGGYVGEGVAVSNLAGRTLADLVGDERSDLVSLPWVDHISRRWEPEREEKQETQGIGTKRGPYYANSTSAFRHAGWIVRGMLPYEGGSTDQDTGDRRRLVDGTSQTTANQPARDRRHDGHRSIRSRSERFRCKHRPFQRRRYCRQLSN